MDLAALSAFLSVFDGGSFTTASRATGVPKSSISKRVQDLEAVLGARLFERTTRALRPTPEGELLAARARPLLADARAIERDFLDGRVTPRGRLRVSVPVAFGQSFMGPVAAAYRRRFPEVRFEALDTDRHVDLVAEEFDCAIRPGPLHDSGLIARVFARSRLTLVCAPALSGGAAPPHRPQDLADWPRIAFAPHGAALPWRLQTPGGIVEIGGEPAVTLGNLLAVTRAAAAGAGLALVPDHLVRAELSAGRLVEIGEGWGGAESEIAVIYAGRRFVPARLRGFVELLFDLFPDGRLLPPVDA